MSAGRLAASDPPQPPPLLPPLPRARAAGLPPFDSIDLWPFLSGANATAPRSEIPISSFALLSGDWKYLTGQVRMAAVHRGGRAADRSRRSTTLPPPLQIADAGYESPVFPNASSPASQPGNVKVDCKNGCLFNLGDDPYEAEDVGAKFPAVKARLAARLQNRAWTCGGCTRSREARTTAPPLRSAVSLGFYQNHDDFGNGVCGPNVTIDCESALG